MISKITYVTTAVFDGAERLGYVYPETIYGDEIQAEINYSHKGDPEGSICVQIGEHLFPEHQIRHLVNKLDEFKELCKHIDKE